MVIKRSRTCVYGGRRNSKHNGRPSKACSPPIYRGGAAARVEVTGDVVDIGRAKATRQVIARGGRIEQVSAVGNVVKSRKRLLHVEEAVECRVGEAYTGLTAGSQILVDERHATCPERGGCARAADGDPARRGTACIHHRAVDRVAGRGIGVCCNIGYLPVAIAILVIDAWAALPGGKFEGIADTSAAPGPFGTPQF